MATTIQREAGEAKGQSGLSTSHRANEAQLSMPPSRATSRPTPKLSFATIGTVERYAVVSKLTELGGLLYWASFPDSGVSERRRKGWCAASDRLTEYAVGRAVLR